MVPAVWIFYGIKRLSTHQSDRLVKNGNEFGEEVGRGLGGHIVVLGPEFGVQDQGPLFHGSRR